MGLSATNINLYPFRRMREPTLSLKGLSFQCFEFLNSTANLSYNKNHSHQHPIIPDYVWLIFELTELHDLLYFQIPDFTQITLFNFCAQWTVKVQESEYFYKASNRWLLYQCWQMRFHDFLSLSHNFFAKQELKLIKKSTH